VRSVAAAAPLSSEVSWTRTAALRLAPAPARRCTLAREPVDRPAVRATTTTAADGTRCTSRRMRYENALPRTVLDALRLLTNVRRQASQPGLSMLSIDAAVSGTPIVLYLSPAIRQRTEHRRYMVWRYDIYTHPNINPIYFTRTAGLSMVLHRCSRLIDHNK
jgi:hypothetical protein